MLILKNWYFAPVFCVGGGDAVFDDDGWNLTFFLPNKANDGNARESDKRKNESVTKMYSFDSMKYFPHTFIIIIIVIFYY